MLTVMVAEACSLEQLEPRKTGVTGETDAELVGFRAEGKLIGHVCIPVQVSHSAIRILLRAKDIRRRSYEARINDVIVNVGESHWFSEELSRRRKFARQECDGKTIWKETVGFISLF